MINFHIEVAGEDPGVLVRHIRSLGAAVGVTINPGTDVGSLDPILSDVDLVLVMSVWPGFGGQSFMPEVLSKVSALRRRLRPDQRLEIDGGIGPETVGLAVEAGADMLVAGTAVVGRPDPAVAVGSILDGGQAAASWMRACDRR